MPSNTDLYRELYRVRRFEETILDEFSSGAFYGTTHTYIGQEANAVGVISALYPEDIVFSNHRCHGHFLAYGGDMQGLYAELMGKSSGVGGGRGGSQHIHWKNFYSNGVLGSTVPIGTGTALAEKLKGNDTIAVIFFGDGALGEGVVYESLNMASLWGVPVLYIVENNNIAQTTPTSMALAGSIKERFEAFSISATEIDSSDVIDIHSTASELVKEVREQQTPRALIIHTHRFGPHSKGDDTRSEEEIAKLRSTRDPINIHAERVLPKEIMQIQSAIDEEVNAAFQSAQESK